MDTPLPRTGCPDNARGVALIMAIFFAITVAGVIAAGTLVIRAHRAETELSFRVHGQAMQFARSGITEALAWFRKSAVQPVTAFDPQLDPLASPPILETEDPAIGIMREFQITGTIWGRYEVWKRWDTDPDPQRLAWRKKMQCEDVSAAVGAAGAGNVWKLRSIGYVFRQVDPAVPFDTYPNRVIANAMFGSEIRRLTLAPPGQAAICVKDGDLAAILNSTSVQAGTTANAIFFDSDDTSSGVTVSGGARITGPISGIASYDDSVEAVFGVSAADLEVLADDRITNAALFPSPVAANSLYYVKVPTLSFTPALPLVGTAVIYVEGDVVFQAGNTSYFTGMLYVDGNLTIREPCEFNGTIICTGSVTIDGQSDWVNITYDDDALNDLRTAIGQYRLSAAISNLFSGE